MSINRYTLTQLDSILPGRINVFIGCASYEARCLSIPSALDPQKVGVALIAHNKNLVKHVGANAEKLAGRFGTACIPVEIDSGNPLQTADAIAHGLSKSCRNGGTYFVDITTFTHESLLILLKLLKERVTASCKVLIGYAGAADYDPNRKGATKWLSSGVADVRSVLGYAGQILPSRKSHLVILVGFEHERAAKLIETFEPSRISLGHGMAGTATNAKHQAATDSFHKLVFDMAARYAPVESFEFSCSDPWDSKRAILERMKAYPDCNVTVAPMNTKLSTVGCALAALEDERVQVCYAQAMRYNYESYSVPGDSCYLFELPELITPKTE